MKRALLTAWLVVFFVWPLGQHALVRAYDIYPWRFAGWAAFAAPVLPPNVVLFEVDYREAKTLDDIKAIKIGPAYLSGSLNSEVRHYRTDRTDLGRFVPPPERLGRKLLDEHGETGMVLVVVVTRKIDRATGRMQTNIEKYPYSAEKMKPTAEVE